MKVDKQVHELRSIARSRLEQAGIVWSELNSQASQIIVFGSFALRAATQSSDLDILCVGEGRRIRSAELHLIWIPRQRTMSAEWLGSELATHVAAYGKWIKGRNTWAFVRVPSEYALSRKKEKIHQRTLALVRHWSDLGTQYKNRHLLQLRRDLQRYVLMKAGEAPLPKLNLDCLWTDSAGKNPWESLLDHVPELVPQLEFLITNSNNLWKCWHTEHLRRIGPAQ